MPPSHYTNALHSRNARGALFKYPGKLITWSGIFPQGTNFSESNTEGDPVLIENRRRCNFLEHRTHFLYHEHSILGCGSLQCPPNSLDGSMHTLRLCARRSLETFKQPVPRSGTPVCMPVTLRAAGPLPRASQTGIKSTHTERGKLHWLGWCFRLPPSEPQLLLPTECFAGWPRLAKSLCRGTLAHMHWLAQLVVLRYLQTMRFDSGTKMCRSYRLPSSYVRSSLRRRNSKQRLRCPCARSTA
jgi:hypothetical protein